MDTHRSKMKSRSSSAPGAPGFILPASSLPCASADSRRVWGKERSCVIPCAEGRWKPKPRAGRCSEPASAPRRQRSKNHVFPREKQAPSEGCAVSAPAPSQREGTGRWAKGRGNPSPERIWDRFLPSRRDGWDIPPKQRRDGESRCPPTRTKAPSLPNNFIY